MRLASSEQDPAYDQLDFFYLEGEGGTCFLAGQCGQFLEDLLEARPTLKPYFEDFSFRSISQLISEAAMENWSVRRRHLPHVDVDGKPYFVTGCLKGSISHAGLSSIRRRRDTLDAQPTPVGLSVRQWQVNKNKLLFKFIDDLLDGRCPVEHLRDERVARQVIQALLHFAEVRYHLFAFVVMPSHHHWLFLPTETYSVEFAARRDAKTHLKTPRMAICHSIQSYTATMCNRILNQKGDFWQNETYDHFARDEHELLRIIDYIENNPVKAGLVERPEAWKHSSASLRDRLGITAGQAIPRIDY